MASFEEDQPMVEPASYWFDPPLNSDGSHADAEMQGVSAFTNASVAMRFPNTNLGSDISRAMMNLHIDETSATSASTTMEAFQAGTLVTTNHNLNELPAASASADVEALHAGTLVTTTRNFMELPVTSASAGMEAFQRNTLVLRNRNIDRSPAVPVSADAEAQNSRLVMFVALSHAPNLPAGIGIACKVTHASNDMTTPFVGDGGRDGKHGLTSDELELIAIINALGKARGMLRRNLDSRLFKSVLVYCGSQHTMKDLEKMAILPNDAQSTTSPKLKPIAKRLVKKVNWFRSLEVDVELRYLPEMNKTPGGALAERMAKGKAERSKRNARKKAKRMENALKPRPLGSRPLRLLEPSKQQAVVVLEDPE